MSRAQSFWRSTARLLLAGSLLTAIVISPANPASAVSIEAIDQLGGFEQGGNQALDAVVGDADWESVQTTTAINVPDDSIRLVNGVELDNPNWTCANETGVPSRTNLQRAYINGPRPSYNNNDDHIYLDLAWVRQAAVDAVGFFQFEPEAHVAMEFNQELLTDVVLTNDPTTPCGVERTEGDVLVTWDLDSFDVGGDVDVQLYQWVGGSWDDTGLVQGVHATGGANGFGIGSIADFTPEQVGQTGNLGLLRFGEATLDLTALGLVTNNGCLAAGTVHGRSRDDNNIDGDAMDRLPFTQVRYQKPDCTTIVLRKALTSNDANAKFDLKVGNEVVVDNAVNGSSNAANPYVLSPGVHQITEAGDGTILANYDTTLSCKDQDGDVLVTNGSITVDLGDAIDCTFGNTQKEPKYKLTVTGTVNNKPVLQTDKFTVLLEVSNDGGDNYSPLGGETVDLQLTGVGKANNQIDDNGNNPINILAVPDVPNGMPTFNCKTDNDDDPMDGVARGYCIIQVTAGTPGLMTLYAAFNEVEVEQLDCQDCFVAAALPVADANGEDAILWQALPGGGGDDCDELAARHSSGSRSAASRGGGDDCDEEEEEFIDLPVGPETQSPDTSNQGQQENESPNLTPSPAVDSDNETAGDPQVAGTELDAPAAPQNLPRTGASNMAGQVRLALVLVITGLAALVFGRRRRAGEVSPIE